MHNCSSQDLIQLYGQSDIFADLSVNGSHFAKCSALNQCVKLSVKFTARLFSVISVIASDCHAYEKNRIRGWEKSPVSYLNQVKYQTKAVDLRLNS